MFNNPLQYRDIYITYFAMNHIKLCTYRSGDLAVVFWLMYPSIYMYISTGTVFITKLFLL